jgi:hypothetical protein
LPYLNNLSRHGKATKSIMNTVVISIKTFSYACFTVLKFKRNFSYNYYEKFTLGILGKYSWRVWIKFIWFRIGTNGGVL